jgi:hypothetical protein
MAAKNVSDKMGIKKNSRAVFVHAPEGVLKSIHLPELKKSSRLSGNFDYIHLFTTTESDLQQQFPKLKKHLGDTGMLWVSWPKSKQLDSDLTMFTVIRIGYDHGLVESKALSIDETWSALKFTHPKKGKAYKNSYGKLNRVVASL